MRPYVQLSVVPDGALSRVRVQVFDADSDTPANHVWSYEFSSGRAPAEAARDMDRYVHGLLAQTARHIAARAAQVQPEVGEVPSASSPQVWLSPRWLGKEPPGSSPR